MVPLFYLLANGALLIEKKVGQSMLKLQSEMSYLAWLALRVMQ